MKTRQLFVIVMIFLLLGVFPAGAKGDGIPIVRLDAYSSLRENRQLAYIEVEKESETMELFVNIVSLSPGENVTWVVPLRTTPSSASVTPTTDQDFRKEHNIEGLITLGKRQTEGLSRVKEHISGEAGAKMGSFLLMGGLAYLFYGTPMQYMGTDGSTPVYSEPGFSVELRSFYSQASMEEFYRSLNLTLPEDVEELLTEYSSYSIAVANLTTKPPIPERDYNDLLDVTPNAMAAFKEYVEIHPQITVLDRYAGPTYFLEYGVVDSGLQKIFEEFKDELEASSVMNRTDQGHDYVKDFNLLAQVTYGYGKMEGYTLSMTLPLHKGKAFFPLGTTSAWHAVSEVEVVFECDDDHGIDFDHEPDYEAFEDGEHYYIWKFKNTAPDYDLEGNYHSENNGWKKTTRGVNTFFYDNALMLSYILLFLLVFLGLVAVITLFQTRIEKEKDLSAAVSLALAMILFTFVLPFVFVVLFLFMMKTSPFVRPFLNSTQQRVRRRGIRWCGWKPPSS